MLKPRIIPCLLIKNKGLTKTINFDNPTYIGDPINTVKIFNEKEVDEIIFLDIEASKDNISPDFELIKDIATECFMPVTYGGGIRNIEDVKKIINLGVEKICINNHIINNPDFIKKLADEFGSQSIIASLDIKKDLFGNHKLYNHTTNKITHIDPLDFAIKLANFGAGEIFLNSVDKDGTMNGYDIEIIKKISSAVNIPLIACGGAGKFQDFKNIINSGASSAAAGSFFIFQGKHKAVLITYPSAKEIEELLK